ncbi:hypothetical protein [Clostridium estertheticum]|nr:hypothetical protein [Clostridium estertheticum]
MTNKEKAEWTFKEMAKRRKAKENQIIAYEITNVYKVRRRSR